MAAFPGPYRVPYPYIPDQTEGARSQLARNYAEIEEWIKGLPWGHLGRGVKTADQLNITTEADITGLSATVTVGASRIIKISALVLWQATGGIPTSVINVYRDAVAAAVGRIETETILDTHYHTASGSVLDVAPSAGSHTYKVTMQRVLGTGDIDILAGATYPSWLLVEDIGPA